MNPGFSWAQCAWERRRYRSKISPGNLLLALGKGLREAFRAWVSSITTRLRAASRNPTPFADFKKCEDPPKPKAEGKSPKAEGPKAKSMMLVFFNIYACCDAVTYACTGTKLPLLPNIYLRPSVGISGKAFGVAVGFTGS